jgi:hypothetical protein
MLFTAPWPRHSPGIDNPYLNQVQTYGKMNTVGMDYGGGERIFFERPAPRGAMSWRFQIGGSPAHPGAEWRGAEASLGASER